MERKDLIRELRELQTGNKLKITEDADMARYTSFRAGGKALALVEVESEEQLKAVLRLADDKNIPHMLLGNGSNTLFKDSGYEGLVIKPGDYFNYLAEESDTRLRIGVSMLLSAAAKMVLEESLTGMEFASGIPGSIGGAVFMNAGAYGGEIKDIVTSVHALSPDGREERDFTCEEMEFGYRSSVLQSNGWIATEVTIELAKGDRKEIAAKMKELAEKRNSKQPVNYPSAGSTFKRPEGYFAGKLIEDAGLKGLTVGGAQVSTLHSGFVINKGGATAADILQLISLVQNTVYDKFSVMLEPEVRIIG